MAEPDPPAAPTPSDGPSPGPPSPAPTASAPTISLPKGGGAIHGIGEKFATNPVTGTASLFVPVITSPGRGDVGPQMSLSYDSGSGNGVFGLGWSLSVPAITRKTDKGVPRYDDAAESDVFLLAGAEDLVPLLQPDGSRHEDTTTWPGYTVHRYRPRVEKSFARIERWTRGDGDVHWRTLSRDNVLSVFGVDAAARICDPTDPSRVFSWLLSHTRDDKGNAVVYDHVADTGDGVDLGAAHERHRGGAADPRRATMRYLKRVRYGNRVPLLDGAGRRQTHLADADVAAAGWMFEVVLDYDEGHLTDPVVDAHGLSRVTASVTPTRPWGHRDDAFSSYRAGFEVRTTRLCHRILMFHHFPHDTEVGDDCLVRSTELGYLHPAGSAPAPSYTFLSSVTQRGYRRVDGSYLMAAMPPVEFSYSPAAVHTDVVQVARDAVGEPPLGEHATQFVDLYGEGAIGILAEQAGAWFYRRNLSPIADACRFSEPEPVGGTPNATLATAQLLDLAGDGRPDLVVLDGPAPGFYELDENDQWQAFRPFATTLNRSATDPRLRFADLDGDGLTDALVTEEAGLVWHRSLGEDGFGPGLTGSIGERVDFSSAEALHLTDMTGDGLADIVRVRNGDVCYWPNLGHGRFGAKVTMDDSPRFDAADRFDPGRLRLGDIDGTGTTDVVYLHDDGPHLYFNECGNAWSPGTAVSGATGAGPLEVVEVRDLLGTGTSCLVWSSGLPGAAAHPLRYIALMGPDKPHLLTSIANNLGAETAVRYAPSTRYYLEDQAAGDPWLRPLPFPVHVVARVETKDLLSGTGLVSRYSYHHGYFDGFEREFRGFGMVDQWDAEETGALGAGERPPVLTRTWFHTGIDGARTSRYHHKYHQGTALLADSVLPAGLGEAEEREANRALRGSLLRQEVYADDAGTAATAPQVARAARPYSVTEARYDVRLLQPRGGQRHASFFTHGREAVTATYERSEGEPRLRHTLTLEVDDYGNTLSEATAAYGRGAPEPSRAVPDAARQATTLVSLSHHAVTEVVDTAGSFRTPLPCDISTYELTGFVPTASHEWYQHSDLLAESVEIPFDALPGATACRRVLTRTRTLYRADDLGSLLPLGRLESRALPGETYGLAFTNGLLDRTFRRVTAGQPDQLLLPGRAAVLEGDGGYLSSVTLTADGRFPATDPDDQWWIPSGRSYLSRDPHAGAATELADGVAHFFQHRRYRDAFGHDTFVDFDPDDLLVSATEDALGNRIVVDRQDHRALQPRLVSDPNGNRVEVAYDALGLVAGRAAMGKVAPAPVEGDSLAGFEPDLAPAQVEAFLADPTLGRALLGDASTRIVYDVDRFRRAGAPAVAATVSREIHASQGAATPVQVGFTYSDGWGRVVQRKARAAPGAVVEGGPVVDPRWVGSGWAVYDNKGQAVRQYEPFFSATHEAELGRLEGVSSIHLYDPPGRTVATVHPQRTYGKAVFDPWRQATYDPTDTCAPHGAETGDPRTDPDVAGFVVGVLTDPAWRPWFVERVGGALGADEAMAAQRAAAHADTPLTEHLDALGRPFLRVQPNRVVCTGHEADGTETTVVSRSEHDIEGRELSVSDAERVLARYAYDMAGNRVLHVGLDSGSRWILTDVAKKPIRAWDDRGHEFTTTYDALRRPVDQTVHGTTGDSDPRTVAGTVLVGHIEYGEGVPGAETLNLRTRAYREFDGSGVATNARLDAVGAPVAAYDFKGNQRFSTRRLLHDYRALADWGTDPALEPESFVTVTVLDALDRPVQTALPHIEGAVTTVVQTVYDEGNQARRLDVWLDRAVVPDDLIDPSVDPPSPVGVTHREYDAKNRCTATTLTNGVRTAYTYDPLSLRLARLVSTGVQDLGYTYDPVGNVTHIRDGVQQDTFFLNRIVEPHNDYVYDSTNRLVEARGREHLGQVGPTPHDAFDTGRVGLGGPGGVFAPTDGSAMGAYVERYSYDLAGNLLAMKHLGTDPANPGWTRGYGYLESSLIEPALRGDRLSRTTVGPNAAQPVVEPLEHDRHGNVTRMPHLGGGQAGPNLIWDHRDQLRSSELGGGGTAYYVYDSGGRRVRKVWEKAPGLIEERIYIGGFELYRRHNGSIGPGSAMLARETVHVTLGEQRIALVETRTLDVAGADPAPARLIRNQLGNHVHSSALELDEQARVISYEEYAPFGSTTYQAVRSQVETPKRFRYTGRERDEETGLYYNGARYLASWLGRWTAPDPIGLKSGPNAYAYCSNSPTRFLDPLGMDEWCGITDGFFGLFSSECHLEPHIAGGIKTVGGALETAGGAVMVIGGGATCEVGVGCFVLAGGLAVTAHGLDTTQSGFRSAIHGEQVDSFTSEGLQAAGVSRKWANGIDAGISVVGSLGASAATRAPAAVGALADGTEAAPAITVLLKPGASNLAQPGRIFGHNIVGVTTADGVTTWSHLAKGNGMSFVEGLSEAEMVSPLAKSFATRVPVTAAQADNALNVIKGAIQTTESAGTFGAYTLTGNSCSTFAGSVMNAAGISTPALTTPTLNLIAAGARSPTVVSAISSSGTVANSLTLANSAREIVMTPNTAPAPMSALPYSGAQGVPDPSGFKSYEDFAAAVSGPYTEEFIKQQWANARGGPSK